jgi:hypothetical protein
MGIGTETPSSGDQDLRLDVEGAVGAMHYCDQHGNNCSQPPFSDISESGITQIAIGESFHTLNFARSYTNPPIVMATALRTSTASDSQVDGVFVHVYRVSSTLAVFDVDMWYKGGFKSDVVEQPIDVQYMVISRD